MQANFLVAASEKTSLLSAPDSSDEFELPQHDAMLNSTRHAVIVGAPNSMRKRSNFAPKNTRYRSEIILFYKLTFDWFLEAFVMIVSNQISY